MSEASFGCFHKHLRIGFVFDSISWSVKILSPKIPVSFSDRLDDCGSLSDVFELVKQSVKRFLNRQRAGLMLGLADLGMRKGYFIGAFHPVSSNIIVMNKRPLDLALRTTDKKVFNAYCFHLLLHEYLHSLGYINEGDVKKLTHEVCELAFGRGHPATVMAERGVAAYFPKVRYFDLESQAPENLEIELVRDFDRSSVTYID